MYEAPAGRISNVWSEAPRVVIGAAAPRSNRSRSAVQEGAGTPAGFGATGPWGARRDWARGVLGTLGSSGVRWAFFASLPRLSSRPRRLRARALGGSLLLILSGLYIESLWCSLVEPRREPPYKAPNGAPCGAHYKRETPHMIGISYACAWKPWLSPNLLVGPRLLVTGG